MKDEEDPCQPNTDVKRGIVDEPGVEETRAPPGLEEPTWSCSETGREPEGGQYVEGTCVPDAPEGSSYSGSEGSESEDSE